ncbi:MAG: hypothetical protein AABX11_02070 [Nanoarchaeota archaeon]
MKKNISATMDRLNIASGIRSLIRQLWKHNYRTSNSCDGNRERKYVMFTGGDGWFGERSLDFGLTRVENCGSCYEINEAEAKRFGVNPESTKDRGKSCTLCGAGINGNVVYRLEIK